MLRRLLLNTALVGAIVGVFSGYQPAAQSQLQKSQVVESGTTRTPLSYVDRDCGFPVRVKGFVRERLEIRTVPGSSGQAFLEHRHYAYRKAITNRATGRSITISGHGYFREVSATQVEGDVWEMAAIESGSPFVVRDAKGRVVLADRGDVITRSVQDTLGDGRPSSLELEHEIVETMGDLPSLSDDFDYCALVSRLTR